MEPTPEPLTLWPWMAGEPSPGRKRKPTKFPRQTDKSGKLRRKLPLGHPFQSLNSRGDVPPTSAPGVVAFAPKSSPTHLVPVKKRFRTDGDGNRTNETTDLVMFSIPTINFGIKHFEVYPRKINMSQKKGPKNICTPKNPIKWTTTRRSFENNA